MKSNSTLLLDLFKAYYKARKNKRNTINQLEFEINYEHNLIQLHDDIINKRYTISPSICFIISKPVTREILAASFRDRVVHHLLFNYINPTFENQFIEDSYSCRKGKGTYYGIQRLNKAIKECSTDYTQDCYVLKLDIQGYFMSIDKNILHKRLINTIAATSSIQEDIKELSTYLINTILADNPTKNAIVKGKKADWKSLPASKSLFSSKPNCGLPIGNLTSQLFSNIYLHIFDFFIKKECAIQYYGRYVDDFFIVHNNPFYLKELIETIKKFLKDTLGLILHPKKIFLQHYSKGVNFVGATLKPHRIYVSNRAKLNFKKCIATWKVFLESTIPSLLDLQKIRASINSYLGVMKHYRTYTIVYTVLLKDRNNTLFQYGYVEAIKQTSIIYKIYSFKNT
ncbi:MAG: reverse transcriptase/maturase family protein [Flavobacterium sp.]|jgi:RNA-directed DNA polymerase|uniref:reverse transcriptase/maturase family protein n=1 Tax=Flavobacterium sp. TaxID=239 RepID=UPI0022C03DC7|nr:reverse transcriptase/maturase family protein [Flavobacterium sp.]MCZ8330502.1 reverse transcriptase/maturase family protein [Flavobacterium sp.]